MSRKTINKKLLAVSVLAMFLSACSLFKSGTGTTTNVPKTETSKPKTEEKKKDEEKKADSKPAPFNVPAFAREVKRSSYNVALFAPLYLDSVFASSMDIPGRTMPRYVLPGLEDDLAEGLKL